MEQARQRAVIEAKGAADAAPSYERYEQTDTVYQDAVHRLKSQIPNRVRVQWIDSGYLPTFTFGEGDLIVIVGPDGLVVNTAKYLSGQPILAVNPDPATIDGILLPFSVGAFGPALERTLSGAATYQERTMAEARMDDGQTIRAVNDLFIGQRTHVSARYRLGHNGEWEDQSSSGLIVTTGTGSTGWYRSIVTGAAGITEDVMDDLPHDVAESDYRFAPESPYLRFAVREPWPSKTTGATLVHGILGAGDALEIVSQMPQNGCIFSDGIEADYLSFNSGSVVKIRISDRRVRLIIR